MIPDHDLRIDKANRLFTRGTFKQIGGAALSGVSLGYAIASKNYYFAAGLIPGLGVQVNGLVDQIRSNILLIQVNEDLRRRIDDTLSRYR